MPCSVALTPPVSASLHEVVECHRGRSRCRGYSVAVPPCRTLEDVIRSSPPNLAGHPVTVHITYMAVDGVQELLAVLFIGKGIVDCSRVSRDDVEELARRQHEEEAKMYSIFSLQYQLKLNCKPSFTILEEDRQSVAASGSGSQYLKGENVNRLLPAR